MAPGALIAVMAALLLAGCGEEEATAPDGSTVDIVEFRFEPETVEVATGGEVTFTNGDVAPHTATADDRETFDTERLETADVDTVSFDEPGTYPYFCIFHPFMRGTVEVVE